MFRNLSLLCLLVFSQATYADLSIGVPELSFTAPTEFTDGTVLDPMVDIQEYRLYCGRVAGYVIISVSPLTEGRQITNINGLLFDVGSHTCQLTSVTTAGIESAASDPVSFDMPVIINQENPAKRVLTIIIN